MDGKLEQPFTGIRAGADGILYYYVEDIVMTGKPGLIECDGAIYYVKPSGKVAISEARYVNESYANGLVPAGTYTFGSDGKLVTEN